MVFDDSLPAQTVVIAPGHSIIRYGRRFVPGDVVILPTQEAEALAAAGFIVRPVTSAAQFITVSEQLQAVLGVTTLDEALLALLALVQAQPTPAPEPAAPAADFSDPADSGLVAALRP